LICGPGIIAGILAVVFGYMGRNKIRESGGMLEGDGFCIAGIILGFINIGLTIIGILIWIIVLIVADSSMNSMVLPALLSVGLLAVL